MENPKIAIEQILEYELSKGNEIVEKALGFPTRQTTLIILKKPFQKKYDYPELKYLKINNPQYWKEQYEDLKYHIILACKF